MKVVNLIKARALDSHVCSQYSAMQWVSFQHWCSFNIFKQQMKWHNYKINVIHLLFKSRGKGTTPLIRGCKDKLLKGKYLWMTGNRFTLIIFLWSSLKVWYNLYYSHCESFFNLTLIKILYLLTRIPSAPKLYICPLCKFGFTYIVSQILFNHLCLLCIP